MGRTPRRVRGRGVGCYCLDRAIHAGLVPAGRHRVLIGGMATAGTAWSATGTPLIHRGASCPAGSRTCSPSGSKTPPGPPPGHPLGARRCVFVLLAPWQGRFQVQKLGLLSVGAGLLCCVHDQHRREGAEAVPKYGWISNGSLPWHGRAGDPGSRRTQFVLAAGVHARRFIVHIVGDMITTGGVPLLGRWWSSRQDPPQAAAGQGRLEGQRGVLHPDAGPGRLAAGMVRVIPVSAYAMVGMFLRRPGPGQGHFPARRRLALGTALVNRLLAAVGG